MSTRKPAIAIVLSMLLPGLGHVYIGQLRTGLVILAVWTFGLWQATVELTSLLGLPLMALAWLFGVVHAGVTSRDIALERRTPPGR